MTMAANNNFIVAPRMTMTQITKASAFVLFDLMLICVFSQPDIPSPIVVLAWITVYIYALLLTAEVYDLVERISKALKIGTSSRAYALVMTSRPIPPMLMSCIAGVGVLSLSIFSFYYGGWVGIIPSGLLIYTGITSAMIYAHRMEYHASIERQIRHDRQPASSPSHPEKNHVPRPKPHRGGVGASPRSDR